MTINLAPWPWKLKVLFDKKLESGTLALAIDRDDHFEIRFAKDSAVPPVIAHEAVHIAQFLQEKVETPFDSETFAYVVQTIVEKIEKKVENVQVFR